MKRLFLTTALVAATALPLAAQTSESTSGQTSGSGMTRIAESVTLQASELIGQRLYLPRQSGGEIGETTTDQGTQPLQEETAAQTDDTTTVPTTTTTSGDTITTTTDTASDGAQTTGGESGMPREGITEAQENWDMVGEIEDVILATDGEVRALVVDAGGFLGMNETSRRVEMQNVEFIPDSDSEGEYFVVYTGDRTTFEQGQNIDQAAMQAQGETLGSATWDAGTTSQTISMEDITAEELIGTAAYGSNEERLGEVSELALAEDGRIEQVIVDVGGFLGIGEKPVALPVEELELRRAEGEELRAYLPYTEDDLDAMDQWEGEAEL